jgi:hypothetical protein
MKALGSYVLKRLMKKASTVRIVRQLNHRNFTLEFEYYDMFVRYSAYRDCKTIFILQFAELDNANYIPDLAFQYSILRGHASPMRNHVVLVAEETVHWK